MVAKIEVDLELTESAKKLIKQVEACIAAGFVSEVRAVPGASGATMPAYDSDGVPFVEGAIYHVLGGKLVRFRGLP